MKVIRENYDRAQRVLIVCNGHSHYECVTERHEGSAFGKFRDLGKCTQPRCVGPEMPRRLRDGLELAIEMKVLDPPTRESDDLVVIYAPIESVKLAMVARDVTVNDCIAESDTDAGRECVILEARSITGRRFVREMVNRYALASAS